MKTYQLELTGFLEWSPKPKSDPFSDPRTRSLPSVKISRSPKRCPKRSGKQPSINLHEKTKSKRQKAWNPNNVGDAKTSKKFKGSHDHCGHNGMTYGICIKGGKWDIFLSLIQSLLICQVQGIITVTELIKHAEQPICSTKRSSKLMSGFEP